MQKRKICANLRRFSHRELFEEVIVNGTSAAFLSVDVKFQIIWMLSVK